MPSSALGEAASSALGEAASSAYQNFLLNSSLDMLMSFSISFRSPLPIVFLECTGTTVVLPSLCTKKKWLPRLRVFTKPSLLKNLINFLEETDGSLFIKLSFSSFALGEAASFAYAKVGLRIDTSITPKNRLSVLSFGQSMLFL